MRDKHCDICGKSCYSFELEHLRSMYETKDIKEICSECSKEVNKVLDKITDIYHNHKNNCLKRFMYNLKNKSIKKQSKNNLKNVNKILCKILGHKIINAVPHRIPSCQLYNNFQYKVTGKYEEFVYIFCPRCKKLLKGSEQYCGTGNKFFDADCVEVKCNENKCPFKKE